MTLKKRSEIIRGWLPQEPNLLRYQKSMTRKTQSIPWRILFVVAVLIFGLSSGLLGAFGVLNDLANGLTSAIGLIAAATGAIILNRRKKKEEQERLRS
jgi:hypothetical protein